MKARFLMLAVGVALAAAACPCVHASEAQVPSPYGRWQNGPPGDAGYFPIAVWLQVPRNAERYKAAGFNLYVGLWKGPTEEQLAALAKAGMPVICAQNQVGLAHRDDPTIVGWMHGDEPDNAQSLGEGKGYGPPVRPQKVIDDYAAWRRADPSRPVLLNLGQGVANDTWHGRGSGAKQSDYLEYVKGGDIVSFDIYPVASGLPDVHGKLWMVALGVDRLRRWSNDECIIWNCIECTRISNLEAKPTPHDVRAEVWMSLIHGSRGLIYFVHQFKPRFIEAGLFADPEMLREVTAINTQIHELAPVLNSETIADADAVESSNPEVPVDVMVKQHEGKTYVFAVAMRGAETEATFTLQDGPDVAIAEVLGEGRSIEVKANAFTDHFGPYDVHLYRVSADRPRNLTGGP